MKTIITDRKEMAQALNFGKYKVLTYNVDSEKGSVAKIEYPTRNHGILDKAGTLYRGKETKDDGVFYLISAGAMITATVGVDDWLKSAERANAPMIYEGDEVAILVYSEILGTAAVHLVQALKPTPGFSTSLVFEGL